MRNFEVLELYSCFYGWEDADGAYYEETDGGFEKDDIPQIVENVYTWMEENNCSLHGGVEFTPYTVYIDRESKSEVCKGE